MVIKFDKDGTVEGLERLLTEARKSNAKSILVFACVANNFFDKKEEIDTLLKKSDLKIFGGIFPQIIYKNKSFERGTAVLVFEDEVNINIIKDISSDKVDIAQAIGDLGIVDFKSMFAFVDAFSTTIGEVIEEIYYEFGLEHNFIGGGAGSLDFIQKPVIFSNEGILQDALILATTDIPIGIGVKHGWEPITNVFQVTKAEKNTIYELDYKSAFEVYKDVVQKHSNEKFTDNNFFDIAMKYPFGISKIGSELVVRDPIVQENGAIVCVGDVKEGEYVRILHGKSENLVDAAKYACKMANSNLEKSSGITLFIDCISRVLFLGDDFQKEIDAVSHHNPNLIGALTLGEIANTSKEYLEFYNKTSVVAVI